MAVLSVSEFSCRPPCLKAVAPVLLTRPTRSCFFEAFSFENDSGPRSLSVRYAQPGMAVPPVHVRVVQTSNEQARPKEAGSLVRTLI